MTYPLEADRFWKQPGVLEEDASGRCVASGVRANIWACARSRAKVTDLLRGGGRFSGALRWQETCNTDVVSFGWHGQLRYLAKNVANFLYEYHCEHSPSITDN